MTEQSRNSDVPPKFRRMTPIGPGIYDDGHGSVHIDAEAMCAHFGVPNTDENFKVLLRGIFDAADEMDIPCVQVTR